MVIMEAHLTMQSIFNLANIYGIQLYDLIMSGNFCIGFIDFMVKGKSLLDYKIFFCPNECEKNGKIILKKFK